MKNKTLHFSSEVNYQKFLAFGHMHKVFENTPGNMNIEIKGKKHKVNHKN